MANWCNNNVQFTGEAQQLEELVLLFEKMISKEKQTGHGQVPPFVDPDGGYMFNIYTDDGVIYYDTKWVPNTEILVNIADQFQLEFLTEYSETAMGVFGEARYEHGVLTVVSLDHVDFMLFECDEEGIYTFEGTLFESDIEIMELLLERKKNQDETHRFKR